MRRRTSRGEEGEEAARWESCWLAQFAKTKAQVSLLREGMQQAEALVLVGRRRPVWFLLLPIKEERIIVKGMVWRGRLVEAKGPMLPLVGKRLRDVVGDGGWWPVIESTWEEASCAATIAWETWHASRLDYAWRRRRRA